jgi:hypothetical protein
MRFVFLIYDYSSMFGTKSCIYQKFYLSEAQVYIIRFQVNDVELRMFFISYPPPFALVKQNTTNIYFELRGKKV